MDQLQNNCIVKKELPYTDVLIWDTQWLHHFMIHQPAFSLIIVEIEKDAIHTAFELLREKRSEDVYIYSKNSEVEYYSSNAPIVIKPALKESPIVYYCWRKQGDFLSI